MSTIGCIIMGDSTIPNFAVKGGTLSIRKNIGEMADLPPGNCAIANVVILV